MPKDYSNQKPIAWFTSNGVHLPVYKGETKNDALQRMRNTINQSLNNNYIQFGDNIGIALSKARKFMHNNSTLDMWQDSLSKDELYSIVEYTKGDALGGGINKALNTDISNLTKQQQLIVDNLDNCIQRYEIYEGFNVTRVADLRMLGFSKTDKPTKEQIISTLSTTFGYRSYNAYLSSSCDSKGRELNLGGLAVHIGVPPTEGAGIYVANISDNRTENEFLFGRHTVLKYDLNSLYFNNNSWYINAQYVDQYMEE